MGHGAKEEIIRVFCTELKNIPMDKITVTDIIEKSGVSRNTFYYHFEDIYALLAFVFAREEQKIINEIFHLAQWADVLKYLIRYAREHKKEIYHIYDSLPRQRIEQHIFSTTEDILFQIVSLEARGLNVTAEDINYIANFYRYAIIGFFLRFLWDNMELDTEEQIDKIADLFSDNIRHVLTQCANRNNRQMIE